jgi:Zn-dependent protease with chaperone function
MLPTFLYKIFVLFAATLISLSCSAQVGFAEDYEALEAKGTVPSDFTTLSSESAEIAIDQLGRDDARTAKAKEKFLTVSQFQIDKLLRSGMVLFGDPLTIYVNKVADHLLRDDAALREQLRFYVVKSNEVNAFCTNQGIIFVTVGMLAQLESEAQLGFVLSHEIVHFKKQHSIESYVEYDHLIKDSDANLQRLNDLVRQMSKFSRELETEADLDGLEIFLKSDYDRKAAVYLFDVLQLSYLPFDEIKWDATLLNDEQFKLPPKYALPEVQSIDYSDPEQGDEYNTHPDISLRRETLSSILKNERADGGKLFIQPESAFREVQLIARFEMVRYYYQSVQFAKCLYTTYLLLDKYPENRYLRTYWLKVLYAAARHKEEDTYAENAPNYEEITGESQQAHYFFHQIKPSELLTIVLREAWKMQLEYPEDLYVKSVAFDAAYRLIGDYYYTLDTFTTNTNEELSNGLSALNFDSLFDVHQAELLDQNAKVSERTEGEEELSEDVDQLDITVQLLSEYDSIQSGLNWETEVDTSTTSQNHLSDSLVTNLASDSTATSLSDSISSAEVAADSIAKSKAKQARTAAFNSFKDGYHDERLEYWIFAFQKALVLNDDFANYFQSVADSVAADNAARSAYYNLSTAARKRIEYRFNRDSIHENAHGYRLGLDSIIVVTPFYFKAAFHRREVLHVQGEQQERQLISTIVRSCERLKIHASIIDPIGLSPDNVQQFNDMIKIYDWLQERYLSKNVAMAHPGMENSAELIRRHGTRYVVLSSCIASGDSNDTYLYTTVIDIVTGKVMMADGLKLKRRDRSDVVNSYVYDRLSQIHKKKKSK